MSNSSSPVRSREEIEDQLTDVKQLLPSARAMYGPRAPFFLALEAL